MQDRIGEQFSKLHSGDDGRLGIRNRSKENAGSTEIIPRETFDITFLHEEFMEGIYGIGRG